jgi:hypothetical protein
VGKITYFSKTICRGKLKPTGKRFVKIGRNPKKSFQHARILHFTFCFEEQIFIAHKCKLQNVKLFSYKLVFLFVLRKASAILQKTAKPLKH